MFDPSISLGQDVYVCRNGIETINASSSSGPISYLWNTGETSNSITTDTSGLYSIEMTDIVGCKAFDTMKLVINELPVSGISYNPVCLNVESDIMDTSSIIQGSIVAWEWNFGDGNTSNNQNPSHTYTSPGFYNIELTTTSDSSCTNSQTISYEVYELPVVNAGQDTVLLCDPDMIALNGSLSALGVNYSYDWNTNDGVIESDNNTLNPSISSEGNYFLTVTNINTTCTNNDTIFVFNDTAAFVSILINNGNEVNINTLIDHMFSYEGNDGPISWNINDDLYSNDSLVTFNFYESGIQTAIIKLVNDSNGCIANDTLLLNLTHVLKIPDAVSANEDTYNDAFIIRALENYDENRLTIFNRWGDLVFEASPYLNNWKGQSISGEVVDGTYFYLLSLTDNGQKSTHKGSIELKRK